jgi:hypothetical protein
MFPFSRCIYFIFGFLRLVSEGMAAAATKSKFIGIRSLAFRAFHVMSLVRVFTESKERKELFEIIIINYRYLMFLSNQFIEVPAEKTWAFCLTSPSERYPTPTPMRRLNKLVSAAKNLTPSTSLRPWTYYILFGLLAVAGMGISEVIHLAHHRWQWIQTEFFSERPIRK